VHHFNKEKGFSLLEVLVVIGIATIVMSVMLPNLSGFMRTYRRDGVIDRVVGDLRSARTKAITSGWQYRIMGFNEGPGIRTKTSTGLWQEDRLQTGGRRTQWP